MLDLLVCPGLWLISGTVLAFTKDSQDFLFIQLLRRPFLALMVIAAFSFFFLLIYWANCAGTSLVQRVYLGESKLAYAGYSDSMEERVKFVFTLLSLESYRVGKRAICIRGQFSKKQKTSTEFIKKGLCERRCGFPALFQKSRRGRCWIFCGKQASTQISVFLRAEVPRGCRNAGFPQLYRGLSVPALCL